MYGEEKLPHFHSGKVRDTYLVPAHPELLLMVASDRISTHNVVHKSSVPQKGELLTALSVFWHKSGLLGDTHIVAAGNGIWRYLDQRRFDGELEKRALVVKRAEPIPIEFVWRRYLTGSLEKTYRRGEDPYGIALPAGLPSMYRFPDPIFTPTDKSATDDPLSASRVAETHFDAVVRTGTAFTVMERYLLTVGITLIDGKMEATKDMLVDEFGTGDCCRMAWTAHVREGENPPWLDKEVFRAAAEAMWQGGKKVPLTFPEYITTDGVRRYHDAFEAITKKSLRDFQRTM